MDSDEENVYGPRKLHKKTEYIKHYVTPVYNKKEKMFTPTKKK